MLQSASISQNGMNLGFLSEDIRCCSSNYVVIDAQGTEIFRIYDASQGSPYSKGSYKRQEMEKQAEARKEQEELKQNEIEERRKRRMRRNRPRTRRSSSKVAEIDGDGNGSPVAGTSKRMSVAKVGSVDKGSESGRIGENETTTFTTNGQNDAQNGYNLEIRHRKKKSVAFSTTESQPDTDNRGRIAKSLQIFICANFQLCKFSICANPGYLVNIPFDAMSIEELEPEGNDSGCICGLFCKGVRNLASRACHSSCDLGFGKRLDSCVSLISGGAEFAVYSCQLGVVVGRMGKQWDSLYDHYFNLQECFGASFPRDLSVRHKALLLGALFLLVSKGNIRIFKEIRDN